MPRRILFVSHQASLTGAPLMLLNFLRWLRSNSDLDFQVLLCRTGELATEFGEVAPVVSLDRDLSELSTPRRLIRRLGWTEEHLEPAPERVSRLERVLRQPAHNAIARSLRREIASQGGADLVYLNSIHSAESLWLLPPSTPTVTHVHELDYQLQQPPRKWIDDMVSRSRRYVAAANIVRDTLMTKLAIDPNAIDVCHEFIPISDALVDTAAASRVRRELDLSPDALIVGSVGTVAWIKAPDILVHVARRVLEMAPEDREIVFVWVGEDRFALTGVRHDLEHAGLSERVRFVGPRADIRTVMSLFDVFVLPSRSDPFPLVCLEAASLAKPVVCFDAGGMREFLPLEEHLVIPYLDIDAMSDRILELLSSPDERTRIGELLSARVRERHRLEVGAPRLLEIIERMFSPAPHRTRRRAVDHSGFTATQ